MKNFTILVIGFSLALSASKCDDEEGDSNSDESSAIEVTPLDAMAGGCDNQENFDQENCEGIDDYTECVTTDCDAQYKECLGENYMNGDFTGAPCEAMMTCASSADDACDNACVPDNACTSCLVKIATCAVNCIGLITCGTNTEGGPCDQLDSCCIGLDDIRKVACDLQKDAAKMGGDEACQPILDAYGC